MNKKIVIFSGVLIFLCIAIVSFSIGRKLTLIAQEDIYIVKALNDVSTSKNLIKILKKGERAEILDCIDIKSYIVVKVQLINNQEGYVAQGRFIIEEMPAFYGFPQQTSIFLLCPI